MKETPKPEDDLKAENQKIIDHHVVENGKTSPPDNHSTNVPDNFITIEDTLPQNHSSNVRVPEFSQDSKATIAAVADFFKSFSSDELAEFSKDE